jgi:hypothetical protein
MNSVWSGRLSNKTVTYSVECCLRIRDERGELKSLLFGKWRFGDSDMEEKCRREV